MFSENLGEGICTAYQTLRQIVKLMLRDRQSIMQFDCGQMTAHPRSFDLLD